MKALGKLLEAKNRELYQHITMLEGLVETKSNLIFVLQNENSELRELLSQYTFVDIWEKKRHEE